jgi:predicted outer membrane repeat protein
MNVGSRAVLDGITVANGYHSFGGAVCCGEGASPTITRCVFERNMAGYGGGVYCAELSFPTIVQCTFAENWGMGGGGLCI